MSYTDERIVKMTFDHEAFSKDIDSAIKSLKQLDDSLIFKNANTNYKAIDNLNSSLKETDAQLNNVEKSVEKVKIAFSALQAVGFTVFSELTRTALNFGKSVYANTLGQVISGGRQRAMNLEAAKFQLEGMNQEWSAISGDIDYAVKDTAYGLDAAAKVASQLVASNVKVGDDMKNALRAVSGVASMTSSSYEEIGQIFTTVASNNRLMTMQLRQLSAKGLNVSANMIKYFKDIEHMANVDEAAINDMVSKGKISFKEFAEAMDYAFGQHAKDANKTFTGALSNMRAALSRIGEMFETPKMNFFRDMYNDLIPVIDFAKKAISLYTDLYNLILDKTGLWIHDLLTSEDLMMTIGQIIGGVYTWMRALWLAAYEAGVKLPNLTGIIKNLRNGTASLVLEGEKFEKVKNILKGIINILTTFKVLVKAIWYVVEPLFTIIGEVFGIIIGPTDTLAEKLDKIATILKYLIILGAAVLRLGIEKGIKVITNVISVFKGVLEGLVITFVEGSIKIAEFFKMLSDNGINFETIMTSIIGKVTTFGGVIGSVLVSALSSFKSFFGFIGNGFESLMSNLSKSSKHTIEESDKVKDNLDNKTAKGVTGGKYLKGHMSGLIDTTKALQQYAKAQQDASKVGSDSDIPHDAGTGYYDSLKNQWVPYSDTSEAKKETSKFVKITEIFSKAIETIKKHLDSPKQLLKDGAIVAGFAAISHVFIGLGKTLTSAKETGKAASEANASNELTSISKVLWSLAGVVAVMGIVSNHVDIDNFKTIGIMLTSLIVGFAIVIQAITTMHKVKDMANAVGQVAKGLKATLQVNGELKLTIRQTMSSMAELFKELTIFIGVISISILAFIVITKAFDVKADDFIVAALGLVGTITALLFSILLLNAVFKKTSESKNTIDATLGFKKGLGVQVDSVTSGIVAIISTMTPFIIVVTAAIAVLSRYDFKSIATSALALITVSGIFIAEVMYAFYWFNKKIEGPRWFDTKNFMERLDMFAKVFSKMAGAIKGVMAAVAISTSILSKHSWKKVLSSGAVLLTITSAMFGFIMLWFNFINKNNGIPNLDLSAFATLSNALLKAMMSMSVVALAVSTALMIIGKIDSKNLLPAAGTFAAVMLVMTVVLSVLFMGIQSIIESSDKMGSLTSQMTSVKSMLASTGALLAEVIVAMVVISKCFIIISKSIADVDGDASIVISSMAVIISGLGAIVLVLLAMAEISKIIPESSKMLALTASMIGVSLFLIGVASVIKILSTIDWKSFAGSEKYLIGFGIAIFALIGVVVLAAKFLSTCMAGVAGITVVLMAIGTLAIMLGAAAFIFASSIEKTKNAFIEITNIPWDKARDSMDNLKILIQTFVEAMSMSLKTLAAALVFSLAMALMGNGLKLLASIDAKTMAGVVETLRIIFTDMAGFTKLAVVALTAALLFGIIGTSLSVGAVGFLVFAVLLPTIVNLIIPAMEKLITSLSGMKPLFETLGETLDSETLKKIMIGLGQMFLIGAALGISGSTLAVSALVFLAGAWVLEKASDVFIKAVKRLYEALESLTWKNTKRIMGDLLLIFLIGVELSISAGVLLGGAVALIAAAGIGIAASKILVEMFKTLYSAFENIELGVITKGCGEIVIASIAIFVASGFLALAGVPFIVAMTLFGIGLSMLTVNISLLSLSIAAMALGFEALAKMSDDKLAAAVDSIVLFITKLNDALTEAKSILDNSIMQQFSNILLSFSLSLALVALILPVSALGLVVGGGLLIAAAKLFELSFSQMSVAFDTFTNSSTGNFLESLYAVTAALGGFVGWFLLWNVPFALGSVLFLGATLALAKAFVVIDTMTSKYDLKKLVKKFDPLKDIGKTLVIFGLESAASGVLIIAAAWLISESVTMIVESTEGLPEAVDVFCDSMVRISEAAEEASENAKESGKNVGKGLLLGIVPYGEELDKVGSWLFSRLIGSFDNKAEIQSPSRVSMYSGEMVGQGIIVGLKNSEDGIEKESESIIDKIKNIFDTSNLGNWLAETLGISGWNAGESLGSNLHNSLMGWLSKSGGAVSGFANMIANAFNMPTTAELNRKIAAYDKSATEAGNAGNAKAAENYRKQAQAAREELAMMSSPEGIMGKIEDWFKETFGLDTDTGVGGGSGGGYTPVYTGDEATASDLGKTGRSVGSSSGAKDAKIASNNVGTSITNNNNYNFIQNNYSPEPIDRTELYTQTNNQLNTWYKWLAGQS